LYNLNNSGGLYATQNLYIPGLTTTKEEFEQMKELFNGNLTLFDPSVDKSYHPYVALYIILY